MNERDPSDPGRPPSKAWTNGIARFVEKAADGLAKAAEKTEKIGRDVITPTFPNAGSIYAQQIDAQTLSELKEAVRADHESFRREVTQRLEKHSAAIAQDRAVAKSLDERLRAYEIRFLCAKDEELREALKEMLVAPVARWSAPEIIAEVDRIMLGLGPHDLALLRLVRDIGRPSGSWEEGAEIWDRFDQTLAALGWAAEIQLIVWSRLELLGLVSWRHGERRSPVTELGRWFIDYLWRNEG